MKKGVKGALVVSIILAVLVGCYTTVAFAVEDKFLFNTTINGIDCSLMTAEQAEAIYMSTYYDNMVFNIVDDNGKYLVEKEQFDFSDAEKPQSLLEGVNKFEWGLSLFKETMFTTNDGNALVKLGDFLTKSLPALNELNWREAEDAYITFNNTSAKYEITPEVIGTELEKDVFYKALYEHIKSGHGDLDIRNIEGVYSLPDITSDNTKLNETLNSLNNLVSLDIMYDVEGNIQHYNYEDMVEYINIDTDTMDYTFDKDGSIDAFIKDMNAHYTTLGITREFKTTLGDVVTVKGGDWGWWLNQNKSKEILAGYIEDGVSRAGEFEWLQTATYSDLGDYKDYVEIDLTNQHLYMYKDNKLIVECDIVSGNPNKGNNTPGGTYILTYKTKNAVLRGPGYASPVDYWMPFNGGIGMHDASWQSKFGGTRYLTNGSHGCINMPLKAAKEVYNNIDKTYAIICYWR